MLVCWLAVGVYGGGSSLMLELLPSGTAMLWDVSVSSFWANSLYGGGFRSSAKAEERKGQHCHTEEKTHTPNIWVHYAINKMLELWKKWSEEQTAISLAHCNKLNGSCFLKAKCYHYTHWVKSQNLYKYVFLILPAVICLWLYCV